METTAGQHNRWTPRRASAACLCLLLAGWWHAAPPRTSGQERSAGAVSQSAELEEAARLSEQVLKLYGAGRYAEALPLAERALTIREKALGDEHPDVTAALANLAALYFGKGDLDRAEPLLRRVLSADEKVHGPEHPNVATSLNNLATLYEAKRDYAQAELLFRRALDITEKKRGSEHVSLVVPLNNLAALYKETGELARSEALFRRMLEIMEKAQVPEQPATAWLLQNLAELYEAKGDYAQAEALLRRALDIMERVRAPDHPDVANPLYQLATLYRSIGDYSRAEALYKRALDINEKAYGPDKPEVATALHNLASLYKDTGHHAQAVLLFERALKITRKVYGADHVEVADSVNNVAELVRLTGDLAGAEALNLHALEIVEKAYGPNHLSVAKSLSNLAGVYAEKGDYARAEPLYLRALNITEDLLGPNQPTVATLLYNLSNLYEAKGDYARAVQITSRGNTIREVNLSLILATGSERRKLAYIATLSGETNGIVSLHARSAPSDPQALELALTTILRRKGRTLDAMTDQMASLRRRLDPQDRALLEQLLSAQSQLSTLVLGGPGGAAPDAHRATVSRLAERVEQLQDAISRRSAEFQQQKQPITIEQVRQLLAPGAALVEFLSYQPFDSKAKFGAARFGPARYVAYVLPKKGRPLWVELGEVSTVDAGIRQLLVALRCPQTVDDIKDCPAIPALKQLARAVDERVMRPVRNLLGQTRQIFLSPDGALNLVPFAALVDEKGSYLIEGYSLTYLTSGRDLLRLQVGAESRQPSLVVADPAFDSVMQSSAPTRAPEVARTRRSGDMIEVNFRPLPGTAAEARALSAILPGARVLTRAQASEDAIKRVDGPHLLHVATHGFFLPDPPAEATVRARGLGYTSGAGMRALTLPENPLLRSGLALAGANLLRDTGGGEDGILTALEVSALNLRGTKLVVLSACETGVGAASNGEGVYGLRRALVVAGSESQLMSLWQVSDETTRDLMVGYYKRLLAGEGRTEALRRIQLEMLRGTRGEQGRPAHTPSATASNSKNHSHPYYWAAFIQSGDWRSMTSQPSPPTR